MANRKGAPSPASSPQLSDWQRQLVETARAMADADAGEIAPEYAGDRSAAYIVALGRVQGKMAGLLEIIDELTGAAARGPLDPPQEVLDKMAARGLTELTGDEQ